MYKDEVISEWTSVELEKSNELSYMGKINIYNDKNYEYKVVTKGALSESGDIEVLDKYDFMPYPPDIGVGWNDDEIILNAYLNYDENASMKGIKSIVAIVDGENKNYKFKYREEDNDIYYEVDIPKTYKGKDINVKIIYINGLTDMINVTDKIINEVK